jgi:rhodanese-related sulfurtransferase
MRCMSTLKNGLSGLPICAVLAWTQLHAASDEIIEAMADYLMFVDYGGATIRPEQIPAEDWERLYVIDTRDAGQYEEGHFPGAVNIEWRQVLDRRDEMPQDRTILVYCNTGMLCAQAGFALRLAGMENVRILQGGYREWQEMGGFDTYRRVVEGSLE